MVCDVDCDVELGFIRLMMALTMHRLWVFLALFGGGSDFLGDGLNMLVVVFGLYVDL